MTIKLVVIGLCVLIFAFIIVENSQQKFTLKLFGFTILELPTVILFIISMLLGMFITSLFTLKQKFKFFRKERAQKKELKHQDKEIQKQEKEINQLKQEQPPAEDESTADNKEN